ncbi:hypothetical protein AB1N83_013467, partial [Pleurotus pulmonarius]
RERGEREAERREREERERGRREGERRAWRGWIGRQVGKNGGWEGEGGVRLAIRMPDSRRVIEAFGPEATLTTLYAAVDARLPLGGDGDGDGAEVLGDPVGADGGKSVEEVLDAFLATRGAVHSEGGNSDGRGNGEGGNGDGRGNGNGEGEGEGEGAAAWWGFKIVNAYPREEIPWAAGRRLQEIGCLGQRGGGQVVVEVAAATRAGNRGAGGEGGEDDGYTTESDDE